MLIHYGSASKRVPATLYSSLKMVPSTYQVFPVFSDCRQPFVSFFFPVPASQTVSPRNMPTTVQNGVVSLRRISDRQAQWHPDRLHDTFRGLV